MERITGSPQEWGAMEVTMNYRLKSIIFAFLGLLTPFAYSAQMGANSAHKRAQQALAWLQRAQVPKTKNITVLAKPQQTANAQQKLAEIPEESAVDKDTEKQIDDLIDVLTMPNIAEYARKGDWTTVKNLIKAGRNVNDKDYDEGWTALMAAARKGNLTVVQELIKAGADVNARNDRESVALMFAAGYGHLYVVKALIQAGADVNAENQFVDTALTV